jgi:phosphatidylserine decarboxylase
MSREGIPTILGLLAFTVLVAGVGLVYSVVSLIILGSISFLFLLFAIYFFRDPKRVPPAQPNCVVSPADGVVIEVDTIKEDEFIEQNTKRIAIFLSLLDVHVNYTPYRGVVDFIRFQRGDNMRASLPAASRQNANILTGLETEYGKIAFKQSTGMIARRLVNHLRLGDNVEIGQKFGIIKFGSRMEIYLPMNALVNVNIGDRVRAAETVIAEFNG